MDTRKKNGALVSEELRNEIAITKPVDPDAFSPPSFFASTSERKRSDACD